MKINPDRQAKRKALEFDEGVRKMHKDHEALIRRELSCQ